MTGRSTSSAAIVLALATALTAQSAPKSGVDRASLDPSVRPQDDLFRYANGTWIQKTPLPADRAAYGAFTMLTEKTELDLRALIEETSAADRSSDRAAQQVRDLYASFMDVAGIDARGTAPIAPRLAEIDAVRDTAGLASLLGRWLAEGLGPLSMYIGPDPGDPAQVIATFNQSGTALPDRDYYLTDTGNFADIRVKYRAYLERMFSLAGRQDAGERASAVLALETDLARLQWSRVESRDAVKTYNKMAASAIVRDMPGFDWAAWAREASLPADGEWVVRQPSFVTGFAAMVPEVPLETWKAWLTGQLITRYASYLSAPFDAARFDFFNRTLNGQQEQRDRWKRGVQLIDITLGEALGRLYVAKHFPAESKARMDTMIAHLIEAYRQSISELDWMSPETKAHALAKLAKFRPKIGYPDTWRDYGALQIAADDLVGNLRRAALDEHRYQLSKLGKPTDYNEWLMTPQTVNAYYLSTKNEIAFPAAILQPPFFDVTADDAANYGGIGAVIGHEIGHGFDDQGRRYDGDGKLRDWWTASDETEFRKRTRLLVEQFGAYSPLPGVYLNGELTLGENIGDLGGLSIAHRAWKIALGDRPSPIIDGLTGDQRFFLGWAQVWRGIARPEYLQRQAVSGVHSWSEFRANGPVGNIDAFYAAFDVKPGDKLYRAPEIRVKIW